MPKISLLSSIVLSLCAYPFLAVGAAACSGNTAADRSTWCDFSIDTDYYSEAPDTGVTREYWLELRNTTLAPDGVPRNVLTVNGTLPGPTLFGDWGDTIRVHVLNSLENNGTSIHFHGIRQNQTNPQDGTSSITQCPTAPGDSITYEWRATQYGTTYYHSHFALQAWEGVFGGIQIEGPASANYDIDAGILWLNDWDHRTADAVYTIAETGGVPELQTGLINGTNVWIDDSTNTTVGSRFDMTVLEGKSYRLRIINAGIQAMFSFQVDNHNLTVISTDLVPVRLYTTESLSINIGQRYDVIFTANQRSISSDFWIRAIPQSDCSSITNIDNIKGILHYSDNTTSPSLPTTSPYPYSSACLDEPSSSLIPILPLNAQPATYNNSEPSVVTKNTTTGLYKWAMGPSTFQALWSNPTLLQIANNQTSWTSSSRVVEIDKQNKWVQVNISMLINVPHPIHFHGHDVFILASTNSDRLNYVNPPRRDTVTLPAKGYVVLGFETNNPGAWLMHCHIAWHQSEGFAMQFVEGLEATRDLVEANEVDMRETCRKWNEYVERSGVVEEDSGI